MDPEVQFMKDVGPAMDNPERSCPLIGSEVFFKIKLFYFWIL